jgi:hypothetical protein
LKEDEWRMLEEQEDTLDEVVEVGTLEPVGRRQIDVSQLGGGVAVEVYAHEQIELGEGRGHVDRTAEGEEGVAGDAEERADRRFGMASLRIHL